MPRAKMNPLEEGIKWAEKANAEWAAGKGLSEEIQRAVIQANKYLKPLALSEQGDARAAYWLGTISYGLAVGTLVTEDGVVTDELLLPALKHFKEAADYMKMAMTHPDPHESKVKFNAMFMLASVYELRHFFGGIDRSQEAFDLRINAAHGGNIDAQLFLIEAHHSGHGAPQSMSQSRFWINKAEEKRAALPATHIELLDALNTIVTASETRIGLMTKSPRFVFRPHPRHDFH